MLNRLVAAIALGVIAQSASAVPFFAKQTGVECSTCHVSYPELTEFGRQFKLTGYTLGTRTIPLSAMVMASYTKVSKNHQVVGGQGPDGDQDIDFPFTHNGQGVLQQASLFTGGKILDNVGAFVQWTYDGLAHHAQMDNLDVRFANTGTLSGKNLIYGVSLNNNPTTQDVFNSVPAWSFPFAAPSGTDPNPFPGPVGGTQLEGGLSSTVGGIGPYIDFNNMLYAEVNLYTTAKGLLAFNRLGVPPADRLLLDGAAPYWRLAYHDTSGNRSWEVGALGLNGKIHVDNTDPNSLSDKFTDTGIDAQYQIVDGDKRISFQTSLIHEKLDWNVDAGNSNASDTFNSFKLKGSYFWNKHWGATLGYFSTDGSTDAAYYGTANGSPNSNGYIAELDYQPIDKVRLSVQYTGYTKFNGASSGYDPSNTDRKASDNNTVYLSVWAAF